MKLISWNVNGLRGPGYRMEENRIASRSDGV